MNDLSWNNSSVGVSCGMNGDSECRLQDNVGRYGERLATEEYVSVIAKHNYRFVPLTLAYSAVTNCGLVPLLPQYASLVVEWRCSIIRTPNCSSNRAYRPKFTAEMACIDTSLNSSTRE